VKREFGERGGNGLVAARARASADVEGSMMYVEELPVVASSNDLSELELRAAASDDDGGFERGQW
jgi:hypothetical protein